MATTNPIQEALKDVDKLVDGFTPQVMLARQLISPGSPQFVLYYPLIYLGQPIEYKRLEIAQEISALEERDRGVVLSCVANFSSYLAGRGKFSEFLLSLTELSFLLQATRGFLDKIPPYYELSTQDTAELEYAFGPEATRKKLGKNIRAVLNKRKATLAATTHLSGMVTVIVECLLEEGDLLVNENPLLYQPNGEGPAGKILKQQQGYKGNMASFEDFYFEYFKGYDPKYKLLSLLDNFMRVGGVSPDYFIGYPLVCWNTAQQLEKLGVLYFTGREEKVKESTLDASLEAAFALIGTLKEESHDDGTHECVCNLNQEDWARTVYALLNEQANNEGVEFVQGREKFRSEKAKTAICSMIRCAEQGKLVKSFIPKDYPKS